VERTVYVERTGNYVSCTWQAEGLRRFSAWVENATEADDPTVLIDTTAEGGRQRVPVSTLTTEQARYVRFDPDTAWRVSWERRTTPTVSLDGTLRPARCRRLHCATTDCDGWPSAARRTLARLVD
ncbi:MAG: hypothetical protein ABEI75_00440, partial [Halobaculum sp.]